MTSVNEPQSKLTNPIPKSKRTLQQPKQNSVSASPAGVVAESKQFLVTPERGKFNMRKLIF